MSEPEVVVVDHHHNPDDNVYRIVIGLREDMVFLVLDEDDNPVMMPAEPILDQNGEQIMRPKLDDEGNIIEGEFEPFMRSPEQMTEIRPVVTPVEDFLFDADDELWQGMSPEEIANKQRDIVKDALKQRAESARAASEPTQLPGVGDPL